MAELNTHRTLRNGLTIGLPCYRCADTLQETVDSLLQAIPAGLDVELLFADDAHTPGSAKYEPRDAASSQKIRQVVDALRQRGINARVIGGDGNKGVSGARNRVLEEARYDRTLFFDADDRLPKGSTYIANALKTLDSDPDMIFVYPSQRVFGVVSGKPLLPDFDERVLLLSGHVVPCIMARTNDLKAAGGYNELPGLHEDQEMCIRLLDHYYSIGRTPTARRLRDEYEYRLHPGEGSLMNREGGQSNRLHRHFAYMTGRNRQIYEKTLGTADPGKLKRMFVWQRMPIDGARYIVNLARGARDPSGIKRHLRRFAPKAIAQHIK